MGQPTARRPSARRHGQARYSLPASRLLGARTSPSKRGADGEEGRAPLDRGCRGHYHPRRRVYRRLDEPLGAQELVEQVDGLDALLAVVRAFELS